MALSFFSVLFFTLSTMCCYVTHGEGDQTHTIHLQSLLPSSVCNSSQVGIGTNKVGVLNVVHRHGPCSQLVDEQKGTRQEDLLRMDQSRVEFIHARLSKKTADLEGKDSINLPAKSGLSIGTGNYIVKVGLGTPKKDLSLAFDTGSHLTWTQCQPCDVTCYKQKEPIFDPSQSSSYSNVSCAASMCSDLTSATGQAPSCYGSTCVYGNGYGDQSFTKGFFGKETLSLTPTDLFNGFLFGCGQNNQGFIGGAAGLLGLGRHKLSVVQQTAAKYGRFFSYCLPSTPSGTGHLTFGRAGGVSNSAKFTPLSASASTSNFYGLDFTGISVGGKPLTVAPSALAASGAIIDSGTVITRLPPAVYSALRAAFKEMMSKYPMAQADPLLDTCYDLSSYPTFSVPTIAFSFSGGVTVDIDGSGVLYVVSAKQHCLAFAANSDAGKVAIYGNAQQLKMEVVYDVAGGRVGFAPGGCA